MTPEPHHTISTRTAYLGTFLTLLVLIIGLPLLIQHAPLIAIALAAALTLIAIAWKGPRP